MTILGYRRSVGSRGQIRLDHPQIDEMQVGLSHRINEYMWINNNKYIDICLFVSVSVYIQEEARGQSVDSTAAHKPITTKDQTPKICNII